MKHYCFFALAMAFQLSMATYAQTDVSQTVHAVRILKGLDDDKSKEWAISELENVAENDASAYAMNCLGLAYMAGVGVQADSANSVYWLERAGRNGYLEAYHNLGMMFKYMKCGVKQDFTRAFHYFSKGAERGSVTCLYDKGFMLYKGLGCNQDYAESIKMFTLASKSNHAPSIFMLGLCYRNGFGVEKDMDKSSELLERASLMGYRDADEERLRPLEENYMHYSIDDNSSVSSMPDICPMVNDTSLIAGNYKGNLVLYDWSGQYILGTKPLSMHAKHNGHEIEGVLVVGNDSVPFIADIISESQLQFRKGNIMLPERYSHDKKVKYRIEKIQFDSWEDNIRGKLELYSLNLKEPERPMYFELFKEGNSKLSDSDSTYTTVTPNPFSSNLSVTFLSQSDSNVDLKIYNTYGVLMWQQSLGNLGFGYKTVTISPVLTAGRYILTISTGHKNLFGNIIKE